MRQAIFATTLGVAVAASVIAAAGQTTAAPSAQQPPSPLPSVGPSGMASPMATGTGMSVFYPQTPPSIGPSSGPGGNPSPMVPSPSPAAS